MNPIQNEINKHEEYQNTCLSLIASDNRVSDAVKRCMISDLQHRYAEGQPGKRLYPGLRIFDEIETRTKVTMQLLFKGPFVDVRPLSGVMANLAIYSAFTEPGDYLMSLGVSKGGHISIGSQTLGGTAGSIAHLNVARFVFDEERFNIDVDATKKLWNGLRKANMTPNLVVFGGSILLFPQPVTELAEFMVPDGPTIVYDAAHVAGLIAGKQWQNPLEEGADYITMSTHKTFFGPQHGAIIGTEYNSQILERTIFPGLVSNHHLGAVAGVGIAAYEMLKYGEEYATDVIRNAQVLATDLAQRGFNVIGEDQGYTKSHIVLVDTSKLKIIDCQSELEDCNILANRVMLPWDPRFGRSNKNPTGLRIGIQELTRLGFKDIDMQLIAEIITDCLVRNLDHNKIRLKVQDLSSQHTEVRYCD